MISLIGILASCEAEKATYGCATNIVCPKKSKNMYDCYIDGRFREHHTGLVIADGSILEITVLGNVNLGYCTSDADGSYCAWGLWMQFSDDEQLQRSGTQYHKKIEFGSHYVTKELSFVVPDGHYTHNCPEDFYFDNSGGYKAIIHIDDSAAAIKIKR